MSGFRVSLHLLRDRLTAFQLLLPLIFGEFLHYSTAKVALFAVRVTCPTFLRKPWDIEDKGKVLSISVPQYLAQCLAQKRAWLLFHIKKVQELCNMHRCGAIAAILCIPGCSWSSFYRTSVSVCRNGRGCFFHPSLLLRSNLLRSFLQHIQLPPTFHWPEFNHMDSCSYKGNLESIAFDLIHCHPK